MTKEEIINALKALSPTASEVVKSGGADTQVMYLEDIADVIMKSQVGETNALLGIKTRLAAGIFDTLAKHVGAIDKYVLEELQCNTINTTNKIFRNIR